MDTRYVVKVKRTYGNREVSSVLSTPRSEEEAKILLEAYVLPYQSDQYYIEPWEERS